MKELMEYREKLVARLSEATKEFCEACKTFHDPFAEIGNGQTVHQIAFRARDIHKQLYSMRTRKTLEEENPIFKNFEPDEWVQAHYQKTESLSDILSDLSANVQEICQRLSEMPQTGWSRLSRHELLGNELTLQLWVERDLAFIEEQLQALKNAQKL